ncbi:hypothetical protein A8709_27580 [Paenibacillus pectinilyticus]|uniref:DUF1802 domain-containing protein n=1 Tax=Paenibacillus pectinilyticus TaxID=512399 RepID=A0A1C0ZU54_9BACL|nr:DUF1802 family protein [Paenibacillus pectinilyticus]OCT11640.1 hypothetical protein A8709_27580 [Paenibacillus pectinilyticus]
MGQGMALKEWASAVRALEAGSQVFIMRKGGIVEETRDFQVESTDFFLYPTYEHQRKELLKEQHQGLIDETLTKWSAADTQVTIRSFARLVEDIEVSDQEQLNQLFPFHIWTENFTEERLKWKRKNPLHIMLLRVYTLHEPIVIPIEQAYMGCKSWIQLGVSVPEASAMTPVLNEEEFMAQVAEIKRTLA